MGTWGVGSFENDQALDWVGELEGCDDFSWIEECLGVDPGRKDLDVCIGTDVVAASEAVAAMLGRPASDLPEELAAWIVQHRSLDAVAHRDKAIALLEAVLSERSELCRLWQANPEELPGWKQGVHDLISRLRTAF